MFQSILSQTLQALFCLAGKQTQTEELFITCDSSQEFRYSFSCYKAG